MPPSKTKEVTPEGIQAAARIATARANKNAGGERQGATIVAPITGTPKNTPPATISSETLAPTATPTVATSVPTPTQNASLSAEIEDVTNQYSQNLQKQADTLGAKLKTPMDSFLETLKGQQGEIARTAQQYSQKGGVDDITVELNDINDRIRREQLAMRRATEAIQKQGGGLQSGAQAEIANIERESLAKQADLAVIQMAVQGRYDSAKAIADRAVSAQLEQQANELAVKRFNYEENKELYTKAEQRAFEAAQADRERALAEQKENKTAIYDLGIQAQLDGAPTSVVEQMLKAKTKEEALALGGSYLGALDREAKRANIAQGWAGLELRQKELDLSKQRLEAELNATGNAYGTIDGKPQNATQALVNSYANRLLESEAVFDAVASEFSDPLAYGNILPSQLQSEQRQQYEQAKRNFVNSVLRRESGAVISEQEFKNAEKQYFPQAGDKPETIIQKEKNRNTVINNFYREANVPRPVFAGDIIESDGVKYQVAEDGTTLIPLE